MKANELSCKDLMIGDLINGFGVIRRVTSINGLERPEDDGLLTTMVPGYEFPESNLSFRPCYAQPIPLTAEILEKNGFTRFGTDYILEGEHFGLDNPSNPNNYLDNYWLRISIKAVNIEYVHELQHAMRLCGIEKEIEL